jgi:hypothetical protein
MSLIESNPEARKLASFVPESNILYVYHNSEHAVIQPDGSLLPTTKVIDHLLQAGANPSYVNQVFSPEGELIYIIGQEYDIADPQKTPGEIGSFIQGTIEIPMHLINPAIAGPERKAKNNHDLQHAIAVASYADRFLRQVGSPLWQRQAGMVAFMLHDIGNILGRDSHPYFSALLWRRLYPNLIMTAQQEEIIDQALLYHDGDVFYETIDSWGGVSFEQTVRRMREMLSDPSLALILADKGDMGIHRLPAKQFPQDLEDPHRVVNQYSRTSDLYFTLDLRSFVWIINFGEKLSDKELRRFPAFVIRRDDGQIVRKTPRVIRKNIEEFASDEYSEWKNLLWATYYPRMMLAVIAAFALGDGFTEEVNIVINNFQTAEGGRGIEKISFNMDKNSENYVGNTMHRIWERLPVSIKHQAPYRIFGSFLKDKSV